MAGNCADPTNPPSLESQILDSNWRRETRNGYSYDIDTLARSELIFGELPMGPTAPTAPRSRRNQPRAGGPDRRADDDGGHFIAPRFNGPGDSFNHFAQNANFNRGAFRIMENGWDKARQSHRVFVVIDPHYEGLSLRPDNIRVTWFIDGKRKFRDFSNEPKGRPNGTR